MMVAEYVEFVKPDTKDYPMEMYLVPDREKYSLIKVGNVLFVPLHQAFDAMAGFRPNEEWRNGVRYCPNCRRAWSAVVRGEWVKHPAGIKYREYDVCTACGISTRRREYGMLDGKEWVREDSYIYCPWCGADMRKDGEENA